MIVGVKQIFEHRAVLSTIVEGNILWCGILSSDYIQILR